MLAVSHGRVLLPGGRVRNREMEANVWGKRGEEQQAMLVL